MALTSFSFFVFLLATFLLYFIVPKKIQWVILAIASIVFLFYNNFNFNSIISLLIPFLTTYVFALLIDKFKDTKKNIWILLLGILIVLGELIYLKYLNLFFSTANIFMNLFNIDYQYSLVHKHSIVGLSYFSLIMISYLIDVYRGINKPQKNILKSMLFFTYFPVLTSGPFIRYNEMNNKIFESHRFDFKQFVSGLIRILWGLFKILVISQRLAIFINTVYGDIATYNGFFIIIAMLLFTLQLYTNFSGSIDVIMGASEIFGINLPENFKHPFFSKSITEFWRNWHITLGNWLKDYIFYPLLKSSFMQCLNNKSKKMFGKKVGKKIPLYLSMLIMWILIGIWHGGAYNYIIGSGLLQFLFIFLEDLLSPIANKINNKLGIKTDIFSYKLYQCLRTYILFSFSMIFFRAGSVSAAIEIIKAMFNWNPWILFDKISLYTAGLDMLDFRVLMGAIIVLFIVESLQLKGSVREKLLNQNIIFRWGILFILIFSIIIFGWYGPGYDNASFIYRQF